MTPEIYTLLSVLIVSLISLVGIFFIFMGKKSLDKLLIFLVALSAGALFGGAFLHLIPQLVNSGNFTIQTSFLILGGIILFFVIERIIHWRHCHVPTSKSHPHPLGMMNLLGDGIHNLLDGLIIAAAYFVNIPLGIATTLAVIAHEIPQEIGDFGVLLYAGFTKGKALLFNFFSALTAVLGAFIGIALSGNSNTLTQVVIPLGIGGFIYIAGSDLIPEIHKQQKGKFSFWNLFGLILGILVMYALLLIGA